MSYVINTFLLVSSSVRSKKLLCLVHGQGQTRKEKNFVGFHNHSFTILSINYGYFHLFLSASFPGSLLFRVRERERGVEKERDLTCELPYWISPKALFWPAKWHKNTDCFTVRFPCLVLLFLSAIVRCFTTLNRWKSYQKDSTEKQLHLHMWLALCRRDALQDRQ